MYGCVGLFASLFLMAFSLLNVSHLMRWSTRSTEEIFGLFISIAFCVDAFRDTAKSNTNSKYYHSDLTNSYFGADFQENYNAPECYNETVVSFNSSYKNSSTNQDVTFLVGNVSTIAEEIITCNQSSSVLFLLLMFGTLWTGVTLYNFKRT